MRVAIMIALAFAAFPAAAMTFDEQQQLNGLIVAQTIQAQQEQALQERMLEQQQMQMQQMQQMQTVTPLTPALWVPMPNAASY